MLSIPDLVAYGVPSELVTVWTEHIEHLTEIQEKTVRAGLFDGATNILSIAPTSSGKTFVGEMAAAAAAYTQRRHSIVIVPFRALAEEHFDIFRERYEGLLSVVISTSDHTEFDADIRSGNFSIAVMTYEKLIGFNIQNPDLIGRCKALVIDEVQTLSSGQRGANLEVLLTQVMLMDAAPQIIALSASLDEINELDAWLKARLVISGERPVPLTQAVCDCSGSASFLEGEMSVSTSKLLSAQDDMDELALALAKDFRDDGKQVIVFRTTVAKVIATARRLRDTSVAIGIPHQINEQLNEADDSEAIADLRLCLAAGVGFHTADLTYQERRIVEEGFRSGHVRILVSTTTLAMGVNLPSDVVILADSSRPVPSRGGWENRDIAVSEYRNAAGRAGRLGKRSAGLSILLAKTALERRQLVNDYLLGSVEPVESQIPKRQFVDVVFDLIAGGVADDEDAVIEFIASTFAYFTFYARAGGELEEVRRGVAEAIMTCLESGLIVREAKRLRATQTGRILAGAGLSLVSSVQITRAVEWAMRNGPSRQDLVFEIASCSEVGDRPWLARRYGVEQHPRGDLLPDGADCSAGSRLATTLAKDAPTIDESKTLVKTACLLDWMDGKAQKAIAERFEGMGAAHARVRDLGKFAGWLFDTTADVALAHVASSELVEHLRALALEARYGLPAGLAPLARLRVPGIKREQLLRLHLDGIDVELDRFWDVSDDALAEYLTPIQMDRLRLAIRADVEESLKRKHLGQRARAVDASLPAKLVDDLYATAGQGLEQAVTDALGHVGLSATRILRQPHGEEDVQLAHADGTVVISVTASQRDVRPIRWNKVKEVLGTGAGLNPINYVCVGRPSFDSLAVRRAGEIAREAGRRSLLLVPVPVLAEAIVRITEERMTAAQLGDLFARERGILMTEDLPDAVADGATPASSVIAGLVDVDAPATTKADLSR